MLPSPKSPSDMTYQMVGKIISEANGKTRRNLLRRVKRVLALAARRGYQHSQDFVAMLLLPKPSPVSVRRHTNQVLAYVSREEWYYLMRLH